MPTSPLPRFAILAALVLLSVPAVALNPQPLPPVSAALQAAVDAPSRSAANRARDPYRHPAQTLAFFGVKPGMSVVEIWPGGGYFTEVIAPAIGARGRLYAAIGLPEDEGKAAAAIAKAKAKYAASPAYANVRVTTLGKGHYDIAPARSADMVLTFRNVHNWMGDDFGPQAFQAFYRALKPGGVLGLEEHRLPESRTQDPKGGSGYVKQSEVIAMAKAAGFRLAAASEINANPKDTADYPKGVWTLPPNYAEGDKDRARYAAIGESDRMTLRFVKPR